MKLFVLFTSLLLTSFVFAEDDEPIVFKAKDTHCVAWKTQKRLVFSTLKPVGLSCKVNAKIDRSVFKLEGQSKPQELFQLTIAVPIKSFDSGESGRDEEVLEILGAKEQPQLLILSNKLAKKDFQKFLSEQGGELDIDLRFAQKSHPLKGGFKITRVKDVQIVEGVITTKFTEIGLDPPTVAGGLIAKVKDFLELHYKLDLKKIKGIEQLLTRPKVS